MMQNVNRVKFMQEYLDARKLMRYPSLILLHGLMKGDALPFSLIALCILQRLNLHQLLLCLDTHVRHKRDHRYSNHRQPSEVRIVVSTAHKYVCNSKLPINITGNMHGIVHIYIVHIYALLNFPCIA